ncbi:MAG: GyrI-like domain-containing protein [Burkholderiaceae bacterium]
MSNSDQAAIPKSDNDSTSLELRLASRNVVNLVQRKTVSVAYLRHIGPYGQDVSCFYRTIVYPWLAANKLLGRPVYGISHDDPLLVDPSHCRYDACVEVPDDYVSSAEAKRAVIPGGLYAVSNFEGTVSEITHFWTSLLTDWLPQSGLTVDERPSFEYYAPERGTSDDARTFRCDVCIPVSPNSIQQIN